MKIQKIMDARNDKTLYQGCFATLRACLESAIAEGVALNYADLSGANLLNAALDGAVMRGAVLKGANLMGANLSESLLHGTDFTGACLQASCLVGASLHGCNFDGTAFGATDIAGCDIGGSLFSSLSTFSLNFTDTANMKDCYYCLSSNEACLMTSPPVVIGGLPELMVFLDDHVMVGTKWYPLHPRSNDNRPSPDLDINFLKLYK